VKFLLDSNICIFVLRQKPLDVLKKVASHPSADIAISSITVAELHFGAQRSADPPKNRRALEQFLVPFSLLNFDYAAAEIYGEIRATLQAAGTPIGSLDMLIAAHALSQGLTLVTNNVREFTRVPNLIVEDWTRP
jgi:tRNA(fMet)-specific endonuclease VapC